MSNSKEKLSILFFDLAFLRRALIKVFFWTSIFLQSRKSQNVINFWGYVFINSGVYIQLFRERLSNWKAKKRTRQYRKAWWVVVVHCCIVKFMSFQRDGRRCYEYLFACVKRNKMDSELLTCLLKFIGYFPDHLSALSRTLLRFFLDNLCRNSCMQIKNKTPKVIQNVD